MQPHSSIDPGEISRLIAETLKEILPAMKADGGGVALDRIEGNCVVLKFRGACIVCPSQELTTSVTLLPRLKESLPPCIDVVFE